MEGNNTNKLCAGRRKVFVIGFATAVKSILQISKNLLLESDFKYLMT